VKVDGRSQVAPSFFLPRLDTRAIVLLCLAVPLLILLAQYAPSFFRWRNGINIVTQASTTGMLAIGMTFVMVGGGIDLSMPANMALAAILGALYMAAGGSPALAGLIMIASGAIIGLLNGLAVAYLRMVPFVVTLAMLTVVTGVAVWITNSVSVPVTVESFFNVLLAQFYGLQVSVFVLVACVVVAAWVMSSTIFGRWLYAVGIRVPAARVARVPVERVLCISYVVAGAMAGLTAILITARLGSASAAIGGDEVVLDTISACVLGGVSIYGGVGRPLGAAFGALLIVVISNALNMLGIPYYFSLMVKGAVIVLFIFVDGLGRRK
jgi:ribose/xylose/arabinose/galactoside ABC-type transport system permease subunit